MLNRIQRNGITLNDMHDAEEKAYLRGVKAGEDAAVKSCFAAICMSLHALHGFGRNRCARVLNDIYDRMCFTITSDEAIQEVLDTMGLQINFNAGIIDPAVTEVEK